MESTMEAENAVEAGQEFLPAFTEGEMMEAAEKYVRRFHLRDVDHDEAVAQFCYGAVLALSRAEEGRAVRSLQWSYGIGYAKKYFTFRQGVADAENISIDYETPDGDNGEASDDGDRSASMAEGLRTIDADNASLMAVRETMATLPEYQRQVMACRFDQGLNASETAEAMGISVSYASKLEAAAVAHLRQVLHVQA